MEAILAIDSNCGLSKNGSIAWKSKKDMLFFKTKTSHHVVIMGKNTYFSLPTQMRPLPNRLNIVLTSTPAKYSDEMMNNVLFINNDKIHCSIIHNRAEYRNQYPFLDPDFKIFIIGGKNVYEQFFPLCRCVWMTKLKTDYSCDLFLDYDFSKQFNEPPDIVDETEELVIYKYNNKNMANVIE